MTFFNKLFNIAKNRVFNDRLENGRNINFLFYINAEGSDDFFD